LVLCCFFNKEYSLLSAKMLNFNNLIVGAYEEVVLYMLFVPCLCGKQASTTDMAQDMA
jgi:hypothetical protein